MILRQTNTSNNSIPQIPQIFAEPVNEYLRKSLRSAGCCCVYYFRIYYWNENIKLLDSFKDLDLPSEIKNRNRILREYCELRIKSYELLYKAVSEDTDQYQQQLEVYDNQINAKIKELGGE